MKRLLFTACLLSSPAWALSLLALASSAIAQTYPSKPLRVIVPQPPGGGFDLVARTLSEPLAALLGQPVVVENRPGGGTVIGTEAVARAEPDGYTILLGASANLAFTPGLYKNLPYNPKSDFVPLGLAAGFAYTLVARTDFAQNSLKEVVDYARQNPGKLTYASAGNGSGQHICAALVWYLAGVNVTHVPYKGAQAAYQDLIPGRVDLFFDAASTARGQVEGGRLKPLAVSGPARLGFHPATPTVRETGVLDFEMESWAGYFVRAATPPAALARLQGEFAKVVANPEIAASFEKRGARPMRMSAREAEPYVAGEIDKWTRLIREAGIVAE
ncbi:MAG TPA: tripartite tricarboxylate transporter substrate binding protein [Burkholderiales bacterium]|nr:tripartite tricarboxylate transporter substrate binding protein [Burkholderiales bacterium]